MAIFERFINRCLAAVLWVVWVWGSICGWPTPLRADWPTEPTPVLAVNFEAHPTVVNKAFWASVGDALVDLEVGQMLTPDSLAGALERFDPVGKADAEVESYDRGVVLTIHLRPHKRIKTIRLKNAYPLFEREVRNVMTIVPGTVFNPADMPGQADLITRLYQREGYIDPRVDITWRVDDDDGHILVDVLIHKGPAFDNVAVDFSGNQSFSETELASRLAHRQWVQGFFGSGRFAEQQLKDAVDQLTQYYRGHGFADVRIDSQVVQDPDARMVRIHLAVDEGPRYVVQLAGNLFFSDRTLAKDLVLFQTGNRGNMGLRRSIQNIRQRYLQAGFADIMVRPSAPAEGDTFGGRPAGEKILRIDIDEGQRHLVQAVSIEGNRYLSDEVVRAQMLTRPPGGFAAGAFAMRVLQEDLDAIQGLYWQHGFLDVRVTENIAIDPQSKAVAVTVTVSEGVQTRVGKVTLGGSYPLDERELRAVLKLQPGDPFRPYMLDNDENLLSARISPMGYPHVQVKGQVSYSSDRSRAHIEYQIEPGPRVTVGKVLFAGNFRTSHRILMRELGFEEGRPFSLNRVVLAQRNLRDLNVFESVQVNTVGLKEQSPVVHLLFETPEKRPYFIELGGGYTTDKGFYGRTKLGDLNFRGTIQNVWWGGEIAQTGYRWDAGITNPRLRGSNIRADLGIFVEHREAFNQDFGTDSAGSTLNLSRKWGSRITTSLGLRYEHRTQFSRDSDDSGTDPEIFDERIFLVTTPFISFDNRDSFIQPTRGIFSSFAVDVSSGLKGSLDNFLRYTFDLRGFYTPYPRLTLAAAGRAGYLTAMGADDSLPQDQLFFLGGTTDVRGFDENLLRYDPGGNPVGGRLALSTGLEARYALARNFELALFLDGGSLQQAPASAREEGWRWSAGLGLRYITPIGPIGLLYGHKLDPRPGEDSGQFHFSIGYTF